MMAKPQKRKKARELRRKGWSIKAIVDELSCHKSSIVDWCRDIELTEEQIDALTEENPHFRAQHEGAQKIKREALGQRIKYQEAGREYTYDSSSLHLMACMLYWGEGAKDRNRLRFTNTDKYMLRLFIRFLREEMNVEDSAIKLRIMHHTTDEIDIERIKNFWLSWFNFPSSKSVGMQVKKGTKSRKSRYPNGICAIELYDAEVLQHIFGAIQEYIGFENPKWVE